jgi:ribosomal protein S18 acetylase RimI-like enzyme
MVPVMRRIFSFIFTTNRAIWFDKDLTEELKDHQAKIPVKFDTTSTSETIEWLKSQKQSWLFVRPKEIVTALKYHHCWASIRYNGQIIGYMKIGFGKIYIADFDKVIEFPEKMAFLYESYILQEYRGKGVATYLKSQALKYCKAQGFKNVGSHVPPWNKSMIHINEKLGCKKIRFIRYFRIFGISFRIASYPNGFSIFNGGTIMREEIPFE